MIFPSNRVRIVVATKPVDFRKAHDGLVAHVKSALRRDPFTGTVYVFRSRRSDRLKLVYWDGTGLVMIYKRLEEQGFVRPAIRDGVTKAQLAARVTAQASMSRAGADAAVNAAFSAIADALAGGETVTIAGFGTFSTKSRPARQDRNPRTGETIAIAASTAPSFKAGKTLRDAVN